MGLKKHSGDSKEQTRSRTRGKRSFREEDFFFFWRSNIRTSSPSRKRNDGLLFTAAVPAVALERKKKRKGKRESRSGDVKRRSGQEKEGADR